MKIAMIQDLIEEDNSASFTTVERNYILKRELQTSEWMNIQNEMTFMLTEAKR